MYFEAVVGDFKRAPRSSAFSISKLPVEHHLGAAALRCERGVGKCKKKRRAESGEHASRSAKGIVRQVCVVKGDRGCSGRR